MLRKVFETFTTIPILENSNNMTKWYSQLEELQMQTKTALKVSPLNTFPKIIW